MISAFGFTDNVQRIISRYVQVKKYEDFFDTCYNRILDKIYRIHDTSTGYMIQDTEYT